jgi:hypothetical protein
MVMIISVLSATGVQNELQRGCMKRSRNLSISTAGSSSNRHHVSGTMGSYVYELVNIQKAIEHGPFILDFPVKNGDFP